MFGWGLSAALGALSGALVVPQGAGLNSGSMQAILVFAFAAAALGGFDSVVGAVVGGLIVGVANALDDRVHLLPRRHRADRAVRPDPRRAAVPAPGLVRHQDGGARVKSRNRPAQILVLIVAVVGARVPRLVSELPRPARA